MLVALLRDAPIASCGCFGKEDTPPSWVHVGVNLVAVVAAAVVAIDPGAGLFDLLADQPLAGVPFLLLAATGVLLAFLALDPAPAYLGAGAHVAGGVLMRGLALADWFVDKASGALGHRVSRRGFIAKTTLVGTAVAASGCAVVTQPGPPYQRITSCGGGALCRDGYTEFCCVINKGVNLCPPGSIASGWWRADYSVYCNGTRYYIDCNDFSGYAPCGCAAGCNTRKVYCNHFRYGQCNQWIGGTGIIACRMVTCVPPYQLNIGCGLSGAVDNATAGHNANCAAYTPPPPPPPPPPPVPARRLAWARWRVVARRRHRHRLRARFRRRGLAGVVRRDDLGWMGEPRRHREVPGQRQHAGARRDRGRRVRAADRTAAVQRYATATWGAWESLGAR